MDSNGLFDAMCEEALAEIASGKTSWRDMDPNVFTMAIYGMMLDKLSSAISRPLWTFTFTVAASLIALTTAVLLGD